MYFIDRMALGDKLADKLIHLRGTDTILVCLKPSSMMVAIKMATRLRAWVFPLFYEAISNPMNPTGRLGALAQSGEFCADPDISTSELDYIQQEFMAKIEEEKRQAMSRLNQAMNAYHGTSDPHILNNRNIVLVGDVMMNSLEIEIAKIIMKPLSPKKIYGTVGNVTSEVSDRFYLETQESHVLDILPSSVFDEEHYFEKPDAYSSQEKYDLAYGIAQYWT